MVVILVVLSRLQSLGYMLAHLTNGVKKLSVIIQMLRMREPYLLVGNNAEQTRLCCVVIKGFGWCLLEDILKDCALHDRRLYVV
jgi:hypothetical protein